MEEYQKHSEETMIKIERANVVLDGHYASGEINGDVNEDIGFDNAFPDREERTS
jgi:hypothetical protein